jgi:hypothetical protein
MSNGMAVVQSDCADLTITSVTRIYEQSIRYAMYLATLANPSAIVLGCFGRDLQLIMHLCRANCLSEIQIKKGNTPRMLSASLSVPGNELGNVKESSSPAPANIRLILAYYSLLPVLFVERYLR